MGGKGGGENERGEVLELAGLGVLGKVHWVAKVRLDFTRLF